MSEKITGSDYCTCELVASTSAGATTLLVSTPTEPFPTFDADNTYFYLTIVDEASYAIDANPPVQREIVKVTAYSTVSTGYSLTVVRGITTTAQIWAAGAICEIRPCAQWFQDLKSDGSAWGITDGITTVSNVTSLFSDGGVVTDYGGGSAGLTVAPPGASYITLGTNATLTDERVLTAGTNITFVDGGAGSTLTINATSSSGGLLSYTATMTSVDLLAWYGGADFEFVPAPDSSHYIFPICVIFQFDPVGTPYNANGGAADIYYGSSSGYMISSLGTPMTLLEQTEAAFISRDTSQDMSGYMVLYSQCAGKAVVGAVNEPITTGNGEMTITTYYFLREIQAPS